MNNRDRRSTTIRRSLCVCISKSPVDSYLSRTCQVRDGIVEWKELQKNRT